MFRVLGAVILFHPANGLLDNVKTYIDEVDELLVIDNSEPPSPLGPALSQLSGKVNLLTNPGNLGIAKALNQTAGYGVDHGFSWVLTMDQDSKFEAGALARMKEYLADCAITPGILTPFHCTPGGTKPPVDPPTKAVRITMTSGNLLNLQAFTRSGPFEEKLFIDSVDHEYCLRLRRNGFSVTRLNTAVLYHQLGQIKYHRILFFKIKTTNHPALRKYYMTRNRLYVMRKYIGFDLKFFARELKELITGLWTTILFEEHGAEKVRAMFLGAWHFAAGKYGKR
jgi:rhamnosyltransferase